MSSDVSKAVIDELRKIVHSMDLHSRWLNREYALTGPQLVFLMEIAEHERILIGDLARRTSLSCATATGIVDRLEQRGLVARSRSGADRRKIQLSLTPLGRETCERRLPVLQERFLDALERLESAEQNHILDGLRRLAGMMSGIVNRHVPTPMTPQEDGALGEISEPILRGQASPAGFLESCRMLLGDEEDKESSGGSQDRGGGTDGILLHVVRTRAMLDEHTDRVSLAHFLHENLKPYEDPEPAIRKGIDYALSDKPGEGGFVLLAEREGELAGALVMLNTGMCDYVPPHLLLFVAVSATRRGQGIGSQLIRKTQSLVNGDIKLHVEYENPARRLYERLGFASKYAEMRWLYEPRDH